MPRKAKVRPYTKEHLTKPKNGHYTIQFRVPAHLRGLPPFGDKEVFKKSTKTSRLAEARAIRDEFLRSVGFYENEAGSLAPATKAPSDHYFDALNSMTGTYDELVPIRDTISEYAYDNMLTAGTRAKYKAQLDAIDRRLQELATSSYQMAGTPHTFDVTLSEMAGRYKDEMTLKGRPTKTIGKLETAVKRYLAFADANPALTDINRVRVRRYIKYVRERRQSKATTGNDLSYLGQVFQFAQDEGYVASQLPNPFRDHSLDGFAARQSRERFTIGQTISLIKGCFDEPDLVGLIYVGHFTGMRLAEAYSAVIIESDSGWFWDVANEGGKTEAARRKIPVHDQLKQALVELRLWPESGQPISWKSSSANAMGKRFGRLKSRVIAEHARLNYHSFRHGMITQLVEAGYHDLEFNDITGHSHSGANTEGGRTYLRRQSVEKHWKMINSLQSLPLPSEIA